MYFVFEEGVHKSRGFGRTRKQNHTHITYYVLHTQHTSAATLHPLFLAAGISVEMSLCPLGTILNHPPNNAHRLRLGIESLMW